MYKDLLPEGGEVLYLYCGDEYIYFVVKLDDKIKLLKLDKVTKELVENVIEAPREFLDADGLVFFRPKENKTYVQFGGFALSETEEDIYFFFTDTSRSIKVTPRLKEKNDGQKINISYKLSEALDGIKITQQIQKSTEMYFVGEYEENGERSPCFGELSVLGDKLKRLYFIYGDLGDVKLNTISIDPDNNQILVAGRVGDEKNPSPFIETFSFV